VSAFVVGRRIRSVWSSLLCFSFVRFFFVCFHLFSLMEAVFSASLSPRRDRRVAWVCPSNSARTGGPSGRASCTRLRADGVASRG